MSLFNNIGSLFVYPAMGAAEVGYGLLSTAYAGAGYLAGSLLIPNTEDPKYSSVKYLDPKTIYKQQDATILKSQLFYIKKMGDFKEGLRTIREGCRDFAVPITHNFRVYDEISKEERDEIQAKLEEALQKVLASRLQPTYQGFIL
jgi:hypothetical protein